MILAPRRLPGLRVGEQADAAPCWRAICEHASRVGERVDVSTERSSARALAAVLTADCAALRCRRAASSRERSLAASSAVLGRRKVAARVAPGETACRPPARLAEPDHARPTSATRPSPHGKHERRHPHVTDPSRKARVRAPAAQLAHAVAHCRRLTASSRGSLHSVSYMMLTFSSSSSGLSTAGSNRCGLSRARAPPPRCRSRAGRARDPRAPGVTRAGRLELRGQAFGEAASIPSGTARAAALVRRPRRGTSSGSCGRSGRAGPGAAAVRRSGARDRLLERVAARSSRARVPVDRRDRLHVSRCSSAVAASSPTIRLSSGRLVIGFTRLYATGRGSHTVAQPRTLLPALEQPLEILAGVRVCCERPSEFPLPPPAAAPAPRAQLRAWIDASIARARSGAAWRLCLLASPSAPSGRRRRVCPRGRGP